MNRYGARYGDESTNPMWAFIFVGDKGRVSSFFRGARNVQSSQANLEKWHPQVQQGDNGHLVHGECWDMLSMVKTRLWKPENPQFSGFLVFIYVFILCPLRKYMKNNLRKWCSETDDASIKKAHVSAPLKWAFLACLGRPQYSMDWFNEHDHDISKKRLCFLWTITGWWYTYPSEKWWSSSVGMMKISQYIMENKFNFTMVYRWYTYPSEK